MRTLERRVAELERAAPVRRVTLLRYRDPADPNKELTLLVGDYGEIFTRRPEESESEFVERAKRDVKVMPDGLGGLSQINNVDGPNPATCLKRWGFR